MFRKIKKILFPTRTLLKSVQVELEKVHKVTAGLQAEMRREQIRNTATFKNHIEKILNSSSVDSAEISQSFRFTAAELNPEIHNPSQSKIAVCTVAFGDEYRNQIKTCLDSHKSYADKWNYAHVDLRLPPSRLLRHPSWYKIPLLHHLTESGFEKIVYLDGDALITNPEIELDRFFNRLSGSDKDLMITNDESGLNMGIVFARKSPSLARLLDLIWMFNFDPDHVNWEQNAVRSLIDNFYFLERKVLVAPNPKDFNSLPKERAAIHKLNSQAGTWTRGDFLCHFSGIRPPQLQEMIAAYLRDASGSTPV